MIKINKKLEYALISLKYMAESQSDALISAREICDKFKTPFDTTAKVLQLMNSHHLLSSVKGIKGGYQLNVDLSQISLMDLARMVEGKKKEEFCQSSKGLCELYEICNIVEPLKNLQLKINSYLEKLSLAELFFSEKEQSIPVLAKLGEAMELEG